MSAGESRPQPARRAYRVAEVAAMYGVSPATIRAAIAAGRIPARRLGSIILIPADAVDTIGAPMRKGDR